MNNSSKNKWFRLRPMEERDLVRVLEMRNHALVRKASITTKKIKMEDHRAWFEFGQSIKLVFLINGNISGVVQIALTNSNTCLWSFYLDQEAKLPKGTGSIMLNMVLENFPLVKKWVAIVKPSNKKSIALHEKLGFKKDRKNFYSYER